MRPQRLCSACRLHLFDEPDETSVVEMMRSASLSGLGSEFDDFQFAPISEDKNGMLLSVLSALARLEFDPWLEAANLAALSVAGATERLASLIASLPDEPSTSRNPDVIAARLVALLPRPVSSNTVPLKTLLGAGKMTHSLAVIYVVLMVFALGTERIVASHQLSGQVYSAHAPVSGRIPSQPPPRL